MGAKFNRFLRLAVAVTIGAAALSTGLPARANDMDPVLARMWQVRMDPVRGNQLVTRDDLFDGLALDVAQALAPNILAPAETLGWSGFFMGLEATLTVIDPDALWWRCGIEGNRGSDGGNGACDNWQGHTDGVLFVPALHVRKGLPYSFELGLQIQYVANSEMVGIGGEIRWAPFEGFRSGWMGYLPDIGLRFTGTYLMGSNELALGLLGGDISISYPFTISGQWTLTPYLGYQFFIIGADHEQVLNSAYVDNPQGFEQFCLNNGITPDNCVHYLDFHSGGSRNFGQNLASLKFHRLFLGTRILWERLAVTPQVAVTLPWESGSSEDRYNFQFSISVGSDF
ncbi:hypothetical protein KKB44_06705 [Candidatus Micrarchaeota archaeon]|nr:hypothetical protein [Candidatus Micrarchaeota archaeon]